MRGKVTVLPEKYSERNLVTSVMGVINDYIPLANSRPFGAEEQVFWSKFEDFEGKENFLKKVPLLLSIGTCKTFYFWGLSYEGKATLLFSERNSCTLNSKLLPNPKTSDKFNQKRPILALLDSVSRTCFQWQLRFISLQDYKSVCTLHFESRTVNIDANERFIIIGRIDSITVLSAESFTEYFTIAGVKATVWPNNVAKDIPYALGSRWLAFTDIKPIYHQLSRCGDASTDESQPLTSTMMNVNKRIWSSLSALAGTVVSGSSLPGTAGTSPSNKPDSTRSGFLGPSGDTNWVVSGDVPDSNLLDTSPGYVSVVDLILLHKRYRAWRQLETTTSSINLSVMSSVDDPATPVPQTKTADPFGSDFLSGTNYLNVHDHSEAGSLVAHFMAHRWASVALLKFDPTGTLLFTACSRGHAFNLFRISNHPCDQRQTAVHHLYILERGNIPCEVVDAAFSRDSRWLAVSSNHGTTHVFPITAYGGAITVRTHTRPYVVNRTSRYHRSSGIEEHQLTRPQRDRSALDTSGLTGGADHTGLGGGGGSVVGSGLGSLNTCRGAPMAGLAPQCPHLTMTTALAPVNSSGNLVTGPSIPLGTSSALGSVNTETSATAADRACACPPNALYNTTNSRLPPYPEPCQIKPQARLRPHTAANATTGAAATALGAASGAFEVVTTGSALTIAAHSRQTTLACSPTSTSGYGHSLSHPGPCAHYPTHSITSQPNRPYCQPLPIVDHHDPGMFPHPSSGALMAACFAPPVCFLPQHPRHGNSSAADYGRDPYGSRSRAVDALFILTNDLYLVEYDLHVGPAEVSSYGEKLYQDGSIRLDCSPVGEWNLRTDAVYLPPFPRDHPFVMANMQSSGSGTCASELTETADTTISDTSHLLLDETSSALPESNLSVTDLSEQCPVDWARPSVDHSNRAADDLDSSTTAAPRGWSAEDAASYWYSQVEITTHLGPLRRVWMGPQFTFRTYSRLSEAVPDYEVPTSSSADIRTPLFETLASEGQKLLPPLNESKWITEYYSNRQPDLDLSELSELSFNLSGRSSLRGNLMILPPEPRMSGGASPVRTYAKSLGQPRLASGRLVEGAAAVRWRNRSGDGTRPISIAGPILASGETAEPPIYIEGGSYQDSSLGGSLSSLIGRSADDVASCIADAMQDEESNWSQNRSGPDPNSSAQQSAGVLQFVVRTTPSVPAVRPVAITVQSALSEADFPSQDTSPSVGSHAVSEMTHCPEPNAFSEDTNQVVLATPAAPDPNATVRQQEQQSAVDPIRHMNNLAIPRLEEPVKAMKKAKRSRRAKAKAHRSGALSATEYPDSVAGRGGTGGVNNDDDDDDDGVDIVFGKKYHSAMTSPCVSGTDSLSSSPAVVQGFYQPGRSGRGRGRRTVSATLSQSTHPIETALTSCDPDQPNPPTPGDLEAVRPDETIIGTEECEDHLVKEPTLVTDDCQSGEPGAKEAVPHTDQVSPDDESGVRQPAASDEAGRSEAPVEFQDVQHSEN